MTVWTRQSGKTTEYCPVIWNRRCYISFLLGSKHLPDLHRFAPADWNRFQCHPVQHNHICKASAEGVRRLLRHCSWVGVEELHSYLEETSGFFACCNPDLHSRRIHRIEHFEGCHLVGRSTWQICSTPEEVQNTELALTDCYRIANFDIPLSGAKYWCKDSISECQRRWKINCSVVKKVRILSKHLKE